MNILTKIQNTMGVIGLVITLLVVYIAASWGLTCLFLYWISLLWSGTIFAFEWSWAFSTGAWLLLILISSLIKGLEIKWEK